MKVFEIFEANEFSVVPQGTGSNRVFNIVSPDGNVVGSERIAGAARAQAAELTANLDTPRSSSDRASPTSGSSGTRSNVGTMEISQAKQLRNGKMEITFKPANGPSRTITGTPAELVDQSLDLFDQRTAARVQNRLNTLAGSIEEKLKKLDSIKFVKSLGYAVSFAQIYALFREYAANVAALEVMISERFVSSAQTDRIFQMAKSDMRTAFITSAIAELAIVMASNWTIVKLFKAIRMFRTAMLAVPGAGWVVGILLTLAIEGASFALTWAWNKYGPAYIADWFASDMAEEGGWIENQTQPMDTSDIEELDRELQNDRANNDSRVDDDAVSRISSRVSRISSISQQQADAQADARPSSDQGSNDAVAAARARFRNATNYD